jgi:4-amino-4-deoxy-L-arabinose transferase-like glycosyltransferase
MRHRLRHPWVAAGLLLVLTLPQFLWGLGERQLWIPLEARYALVAREMGETGRWFLPHLDGQVYPDKPPLLFWAIAALSWLGSGMNEWTVRLPSALAAIGACLLTWGMGVRLLSPQAGLLGALALATSAGFFWSGRQALPDMLLTFWIIGACWALWEWGVAKRRSAALLAGLCMGLATLTKGPVGAVLPVLTMLLYLLVRGQWRVLYSVDTVACVGVFLGVVLSWFGPAIAQGGLAYVQATLLHHTLERYVRAWEHTAPWYFYLGAFPAEFLPWTLFLPQALWYGARQPASRASEGWWFALCWLVVVLGFFSLSSGKRDIYILPAFPAAALLVGWIWARWWERSADGAAAWAVYPPASILALGFLGFACGMWGGVEGLTPPRLALLLPDDLDIRMGIGLLALLAATLIGMTALTRQMRGMYRSIMGCTWLMMLVVVVWVYIPQFNERYPIKTFAAMVDAEVSPHMPLKLCGPTNDLALRLHLGRDLTTLPEIAEVQAYVGGREKVYCIMDYDFYRRLTAVGGLSLAIKVGKKFGSTELLLISNRSS